MTLCKGPDLCTLKTGELDAVKALIRQQHREIGVIPCQINHFHGLHLAFAKENTSISKDLVAKREGQPLIKG